MCRLLERQYLIDATPLNYSTLFLIVAFYVTVIEILLTDRNFYYSFLLRRKRTFIDVPIISHESRIYYKISFYTNMFLFLLGGIIRVVGTQPCSCALPIYNTAGVANPARKDPRPLHHHRTGVSIADICTLNFIPLPPKIVTSMVLFVLSLRLGRNRIVFT